MLSIKTQFFGKINRMKANIARLLIGGYLLILFSCHGNNAPLDAGIKTNPKDSVSISTAAFKTNDGWGYSIFLDGKVYIKQTIIPVIEGNKSFVSEEDATKCGNLVVAKLKAHQKPTLVMEDLKTLGVVK